MPVDLIRYDLVVQEALRGVIRQVLSDVARSGLPGEHHFSITFRTHARGVRLSSEMRSRYPDEMTIILQHQFWDLSVSQPAFQVGLSFRNVPEVVVVPFEAITRFYDPSVGFELRFILEDGVSVAENGNGQSEAGGGDMPRPLPRAAAATTAQPETPQGGEAEGVVTPNQLTDAEAPTKVISIDAFRKKS
ncbi:MAG TPA: ClpXP protease specificity-enhancing factor SspB [Methylocella sp.]|nr:ClpXP protease specificity-enhancing factor SspB [Methylocella sp.]